jgi:SH3-like domain-containing protein
MHRLLLAALVFPLGVQAGDFRTVGEHGAVLYDAPSRQATPLYVVTKDYPLEVISRTDAWVKVRDHAGTLSWIERRSFGERHMVLVNVSSAPAHARPDEGAPVAFVALQDVALEVIEPGPSGWLRVRHADGSDGFMRSTLLWGD